MGGILDADQQTELPEEVYSEEMMEKKKQYKEMLNPKAFYDWFNLENTQRWKLEYDSPDIDYSQTMVATKKRKNPPPSPVEVTASSEEEKEAAIEDQERIEIETEYPLEETIFEIDFEDFDDFLTPLFHESPFGLTKEQSVQLTAGIKEIEHDKDRIFRFEISHNDKANAPLVVCAFIDDVELASIQIISIPEVIEATEVRIQHYMEGEDS
jgi:hypothetical protein